MRILLLVAIPFLASCSESYPVPAEAFTECYKKNGKPVYLSNHNGTKFNCDYIAMPNRN